jgi:protein-S-isoprenylcysteine O-methyltransferase Ste14
VVAWLARRRVPLGFLLGVAVLWLARPTGLSLAAGGLVACAGEALRIWAAGHLHKSQEVTASGPYRWLAHPLYVGSSVLGAGFAIAARSVAVAALVATYLGATLTAAIRTEEARLRQRFGDRYDRYRRAATGGPPEADRPFSLAQALANREHRAMAGGVLVWLFLLAQATSTGVVG